MKHRWIGGVLLVVAMTLAACAPRQGGAEGSGSPEASAAATTEATAEPSSSPSAAPTASAEPGESGNAEPTPEGYDY